MKVKKKRLSRYRINRLRPRHGDKYTEYNMCLSMMILTSEAVAQSCFVKRQARPATSLRKRLWHRCFPVNFAKFLRTLFLTEHLRWLFLLYVLNNNYATL